MRHWTGQRLGILEVLGPVAHHAFFAESFLNFSIEARYSGVIVPVTYLPEDGNRASPPQKKREKKITDKQKEGAKNPQNAGLQAPISMR